MTRPIGLSFSAAALGAVCVLSTATLATAATVTVKSETGTAMETEFGIRNDTGTRGYELAGAKVTATFADGSTEMAIWEDFMSMSAGGANGIDWGLFQNNAEGIVALNSFQRAMTTLTIDLSSSISDTPEAFSPPSPRVVQGASLFDISAANEDLGQSGSTPGSSFGNPFLFTFDAPDGDVAVTYSGAVNIKGQPAVGDLFTTLFVDFTGVTGGGFVGSTGFQSDTDTLRVAGDLTPVAAVPLPAGLPLLLAGISGLGLLRRKR